MYNFNKDDFLNKSKAILSLKENILNVAQEVEKSNYSKILLTGVGGALLELMSLERIFKEFSDRETNLLDSTEIIVGNTQKIDRDTLVITVSKSGNTVETVKSVEICKNLGAKVLSLVPSEDSELAKVSDFFVSSENVEMTHLYIKLYMIAFSLLKTQGNNEVYAEFEDTLKYIYPSLVSIHEKFEDRAISISQKNANKDYHMWIGSGWIWPEINMFTMCILEEMQWKKTRPISSSNFFHGTLELLDNTFPVYLVKGFGKYRVLDQRVHDFLEKLNIDCEIIDLEDYRLENISEKWQEIYSPIIFNAISRGRLIIHYEKVTNHDLNTRRYYRKFKY